jgi:hypothetical protein
LVNAPGTLFRITSRVTAADAAQQRHQQDADDGEVAVVVGPAGPAGPCGNLCGGAPCPSTVLSTAAPHSTPLAAKRYVQNLRQTA